MGGNKEATKEIEPGEKGMKKGQQGAIVVFRKK